MNWLTSVENFLIRYQSEFAAAGLVWLIGVLILYIMSSNSTGKLGRLHTKESRNSVMLASLVACVVTWIVYFYL